MTNWNWIKFGAGFLLDFFQRVLRKKPGGFFEYYPGVWTLNPDLLATGQNKRCNKKQTSAAERNRLVSLPQPRTQWYTETVDISDIWAEIRGSWVSVSKWYHTIYPPSCLHQIRIWRHFTTPAQHCLALSMQYAESMVHRSRQLTGS